MVSRTTDMQMYVKSILCKWTRGVFCCFEIDNPCSTECDLCEKKTGVCLRQQTKKTRVDQCDPPCEDSEECIDGECTWTNTKTCKSPCPTGAQCVNGKCQFNLASQCPVPCRSDQFCINGRCGCYRGLCESNNRSCYEICEHGERCFNMSCSCGIKGKCQSGEICSMDTCMCGPKRGGCRSNERCIHGHCVCKTNNCDPCENKCQTNETCLNGKCVCKENCIKGIIKMIKENLNSCWCFFFLFSILSISLSSWRTMHRLLWMHLSARLARSSLWTTTNNQQ